MDDGYKDIRLNRMVKSLIKGDKKALDDIYRFYYPKLYGFSRSFLKVEDDINDILQDVFVKIWMNRGKIKNVETFNALIFTIAKNELITYFRKKSRETDFESRLRKTAIEQSAQISNDFEYKDLKEKADIIIDQLPEKRKLIFKLSREEGLSYKEIAEKLDISIKTVEDHMLHALRYLRDNLKNYDILTLLFLAVFS